MATGTPISREWVCMMIDGVPVIDWGDGRAQDLYTGDFRPYKDAEYSHPITDQELDVLINAGRVADYDVQTVFVNNLPEPPRKMLD